MVWPNFFLMNVFFALKGSKRFIIIYSDTDFQILRQIIYENLNIRTKKHGANRMLLAVA